MKRFITIMLTLVCLHANAQVLPNTPRAFNDAKRIGATGATDEEALQTLSAMLNVDVTNISERLISEKNGKVNEEYTSLVSVNSSISIKGAVRSVIGAEVVWYIDKEEYILSHVNEYNKHMREAREYDLSDDPHRVNLMLGSWYMAYECMNDEVLNAIYEKSIYNLDDVFEKICETIYKNGGYRLSAIPTANGTVYEILEGTYADEDVFLRPLPGFEYLNVRGQWESPYYFYYYTPVVNGNRKKIDSKDAKTHKRTTANIGNFKRYRLTFEMKNDGGYVKIKVPDEFYMMIDNNSPDNIDNIHHGIFVK